MSRQITGGTVVAWGGATALLSCALSVSASPVPVEAHANFESGHVHPIELIPNSNLLAAVNTADNRLEIFRLRTPSEVLFSSSIPVGMEPTAVRAFDEQEVWVVNRVSDTVSVIDMVRRVVTATIPVGDEPGDVVFAGGHAFVSSGTEDTLYVYNVPYDGEPPTLIPLEGEDPRSLATDGENVYALILHAGNGTGVMHHSFVTDPAFSPYEGLGLSFPWGLNPPPNDGLEFLPPINDVLLADEDGDGILDNRMPRTTMIAKHNLADGSWLDDNGMDWQALPFWQPNHHAMAVVNATSFDVEYVTDIMTNNFAIDVTSDGRAIVAGTHAYNHVRFEPNLNARFAKTGVALVEGLNVTLHEANPHLSQYFPDPHSADSFSGLPTPLDFDPAAKWQTIGDPHGVAWSPAGDMYCVSGRGSNNVGVYSPDGTRLAVMPVGQGPTGIAVHPDAPVCYVLNHFDATITIVSLDDLSGVDAETVAFSDPTPIEIREGRPHFYNTIESSQLGQVSCQTCHVNGMNDMLAWDLGDPAGEMKAFNQICLGTDPTPCISNPWHPMKGPMTTQTLVGIIGTEPLHWRADREDLPAFNPTFPNLQGSEQLTAEEMTEFELFIKTLRFPPNPYRNRDGSLPTSGFGGGNAVVGHALFTLPLPDPEGDQMPMMMEGHAMLLPPEGDFPASPLGPAGQDPIPVNGFNCIVCHALPTGSNNQVLAAFPGDVLRGLEHSTKVAPLRDAYRKDGFNLLDPGSVSNRATGYLHDGTMDSLNTFLIVFFGMTEQQRADLVAFMFAMGTDTHASVGTQVTIGEGGDIDVAIGLRNQLLDIVNNDDSLGMIVKTRFDGESMGGYWDKEAGHMQMDRIDFVTDVESLDADTHVSTWMVVPAEMTVRLGVDRDLDGGFDNDERDTCHDPADSASFIGDGICCGDFDHEQNPGVGFSDLLKILAAQGPCPDPWNCPENLVPDPDNIVGFAEIVAILSNWNCGG